MNVEESIEKFIQDEILMGTRSVTPQDSLIDQGVLDSLGLLRLIAFLEEQFGIEVEDDEVVPENFQSIDIIKAYIEGKH